MQRHEFHRVVYYRPSMLPCKNRLAAERRKPEKVFYKIEASGNLLRAELFHRQTPEEMQEFIKALNVETRKSGSNLILIYVRHSQPLFRAEHYADLTRFAGGSGIRIALVGDSEELRASHHYVELLIRQKGANVRGFNEEASALEWLRSGEPRKNGAGSPAERKPNEPGT